MKLIKYPIIHLSIKTGTEVNIYSLKVLMTSFEQVVCGPVVLFPKHKTISRF